MKKAIFKVPNGKLVKIFLEESDGRILTIKITGDFFAYPEERIEKLEKYLETTKITKSALKQKLDIFFHQFKTELYGVDIDSLVEVILMAASTPVAGTPDSAAKQP